MATATTETAPTVNPVPTKLDFRQEVTDRVISMLENGVAPWQKPWAPGDSPAGMPINPTTGRNYRAAMHFF